MSCYVKETVLRIPLDKTGLPEKYNKTGYDLREFLEEEFMEFLYRPEPGHFQFSPTESIFLDFIIDREWDAEAGAYGKVRELYDTEAERFLPIFQKVMPHFDLSTMKLVRVVEYCFYNCSEAPDYYDIEEDHFYKEIFWP